MRHATMLVAILALASLNACELVTGPEELTMQVQGTVTAADDGSPIAGASVRFVYVEATTWPGIFGPWIVHTVDRSITDAQGHFSLSYVKEGFCGDSLFHLVANAQGFAEEFIWFTQDPHITCTEALQTIDLQLERETT